MIDPHHEESFCGHADRFAALVFRFQLTFALTTRPVSLFYSLMRCGWIEIRLQLQGGCGDPDHDGRIRNIRNAARCRGER
jgi:hypothetical protein